MKFTIISLFCILTFFSCEDTKADNTDDTPIQYSTVKGFVNDKETSNAIIFGYHINTVYIRIKDRPTRYSPVSPSGTYEIQNTEHGEHIIYTVCKYYEDFRDTIQVSGTEVLFDIWLDKMEEGEINY